MSEFKIAIIAAIVGGISGGLIGGLLGILGVRLGNRWNIESTNKTVEISFKKAEELINKQEFLKAAAEFESAFTEEIILLETPATTNPKDSAQSIVKDAAIKHKNAMIRFRPHVIESDCPNFDNAWSDYKDANQYSTQIHDREKQKAQRKLAIKKINKLLEFANHG